MANSVTGQANDPQAARLRAWVLSLAVAFVVMLAGGLVLATFVDGPARPWTGLTYVVAMGLAIVVGLSKTSSA